MIFFRFFAHNYLKKWTPSLPDMDYFVPTQLVWGRDVAGFLIFGLNKKLREQEKAFRWILEKQQNKQKSYIYDGFSH